MECRCREFETRLRSVERSRARDRRVLVAMAGGFALILLGGAVEGPPETLEARRFVLRDSSGSVRATLGPETLGYGGIDYPVHHTSITALRVFDHAGGQRASLEGSWEWADDDPATFGALRLPSRRAATGVRGGLGLSSSPAIVIDDERWNVILGLNTSPNSEPGLSMREATSAGPGRGIELHPTGLSLFDEKGRRLDR